MRKEGEKKVILSFIFVNNLILCHNAYFNLSSEKKKIELHHDGNF